MFEIGCVRIRTVYWDYRQETEDSEMTAPPASVWTAERTPPVASRGNWLSSSQGEGL